MVRDGLAVEDEEEERFSSHMGKLADPLTSNQLLVLFWVGWILLSEYDVMQNNGLVVEFLRLKRKNLEPYN